MASGFSVRKQLTSITFQWKLRTPPDTIWQAGIRYTFRAPSRITPTVALNANNLFNKYYLKTSTKLLGDSRSIFITYTIPH